MSKFPTEDTFPDVRFTDTQLRVGVYGKDILLGVERKEATESVVLPMREARRLRNWLSDAITAWNILNLAGD